MGAGLLVLLLAAAATQPDAQVAAWRRAALAGDAEAALKLGGAYKRGDRAPLDMQEAERWFARAAQAGSAKGEAEYGLALFHNGKAREAAPWLRKAAARGDPRAQYAYATLLFNGAAVPRDAAQARRLMKQAAAAGLPAASEALAVMSGPLPEGEGPAAPPERLAEKNSAPATAPERARPRTAAAAWRVQVGAFADRANADRLWTRLKPLGPPTLTPEFRPDGRVTRLLIGPFTAGADAKAYCGKLQNAGFACFVTRS